MDIESLLYYESLAQGSEQKLFSSLGTLNICSLCGKFRCVFVSWILKFVTDIIPPCVDHGQPMVKFMVTSSR